MPAESIANTNCVPDTDCDGNANGNNNAQDNGHAENDSNSAPAATVNSCRAVATFLRNSQQQVISFRREYSLRAAFEIEERESRGES